MKDYWILTSKGAWRVNDKIKYFDTETEARHYAINYCDLSDKKLEIRNKNQDLKDILQGPLILSRDDFMSFFRHEDFHNLITPSDAVEVFLNILHGSSDINLELIQSLLNNYGLTFEDLK